MPRVVTKKVPRFKKLPAELWAWVLSFSCNFCEKKPCLFFQTEISQTDSEGCILEGVETLKLENLSCLKMRIGLRRWHGSAHWITFWTYDLFYFFQTIDFNQRGHHCFCLFVYELRFHSAFGLFKICLA